MSEYRPVRTLADLDALVSEEMVEGFVDAYKGEPAPGNNRSRSYWHGWRNGRSDRTGQTDEAQRELARLIVARGRAS